MAKTASRVLRTGGLYFNGVNNYVQVPAIPLTKFTVAVWVNPQPYDGTVFQRDVIIRDYRDQNNYRVFWEILTPSYGNNIRFIINDEYTDSYFSFYYPVTLPNWYFLAFVYGRNGVYVYVNGQLVSSGSVDVRTELMNTVIKIGAPGAGYFKGLIDEVRIYNRALSSYEISEIYTKDTFIKDGLVLCLPFHEGEGNIAHDVSGYDNHGTIYGASWVVKKALRVLPKAR